MVLYGRVSQARDGRSTSVDDQLTSLRAWARREGWPVAGEYRDDNVSASRYAHGKLRDGWRDTMDAVAGGRARALLVWEISRTSRDLGVYADLADTCRRHRVQLGYGGRLYDLRSAADSMAVGLSALVAESASHETSERTRRAVQSRAAAGTVHAQLPYGYRRTIDPVSGRTLRWEIDPERAAVVREIARRLLSGAESADAVAADLTRRGVPAPGAGRCARGCGCRARTGRPDPGWVGEHRTMSGKWTGGNMSRMVARPAYAGFRVHGGTVVEGVTGVQPPILTVAEHHALVALRQDPARDRWRQSTHVRHLGSGIYRCGRPGCDGRMRVVQHRAPTYSCRGCHRVARRQAEVDAWVEAVIVARLSRPDALTELTGPDAAETRREAEERVAALRAELVQAQGMLSRGEITLGDVASWRRGWEPRMAAAEAEARPALPPGVAGMVCPDAGALWDAAGVEVRRAVLAALVVVTILPTGRRGGAPRPFDPDLVRIEWRSGVS